MAEEMQVQFSSRVVFSTNYSKARVEVELANGNW